MVNEENVKNNDEYKIKRCDKCGIEEDLPFTCNYCLKKFCPDHRLPEIHNCTEIWFVKNKIMKTNYNDAKKNNTERNKERISVNNIQSIIKNNEVIQLTIAWITLSIVFSISHLMDPIKITLTSIVLIGIIAGTSFIFHELAHKFTAKYFLYQAQFELWAWGVIASLAISIISGGNLIFAALGSVNIMKRGTNYTSNTSEKEIGIISAAGPITNMAVALILFILGNVNSGLVDFYNLGIMINIYLAAFNLIPLLMLDGYKIMKWNKIMWASITLPTWIIAINIFL